MNSESSITEDSILKNSEWMFKLDKDMALDCLKKHPHLEPLKSERVLLHIKHLGGAPICLKYLEYLALTMKLKDKPIHNEIPVLYI